MTEEWRPVVGYEGFYEVSDQGRVRRVAAGQGSVAGRILRPSSDPKGRQQVTLSGGGVARRRRVHHLVLEAFVGPRPDGMVACHWDDNPRNNALANLRWGTLADNAADALRNQRSFQANKTHCPRGHKLDHPNLVAHQWARGVRHCLACHRAMGVLQYRKVGDLQTVSDDYYSRIMEEAA